MFDFKDLDELIKKSIKHIILMRPFYTKLESIPLKKLELDYFKKDLKKNGINFYELFYGCLDCIKDII